jgi:pimeloyl-ACP methyl ester carboxylesterase
MQSIENLWIFAAFLGLLWVTLTMIFSCVCDYMEHRKTKKWILRFTVITTNIIEILVLLCFILYFIQDIALFQPNNDSSSYEYIFSRPEFIEIKIDDGSKIYNGILRKNTKDEPSPLIIMFAGNGQNSSQLMHVMNESNMWEYFLDYNFLIMDYPGYGLNDGLPSAENIYKEALITYDYVSNLSYVDENRIIIGGLSIGTGPAVYLAANRNIAGLFLLAPYASGYDLCNNTLPIFYGPLRLLVKHKFPSDSYAPLITSPVLIVASKNDEVIPYSSSKKLKSCFPFEPTFVTLTGASHNWIMSNNTTLNNIQTFLASLP